MAKKFNKMKRNNNRSKFKKRSNITKDSELREKVDSTNDSKNDASWYTGDSALTFDSGRFNWLVPNGSIIDVLPNNQFTFPGCIGLVTYPGVGVSFDKNSVVNIAARKMYTWIRRSKSSYATYEPADLMQYCIGIAQAYQYYNFMIRLYGLLNVYSQLNRYIPDTLISANGVNPNSLRSDMADFLFYINKYGSQLSSLAAPATLPYFRRQAWMYSNVYTDDQTGKSTMYQFIPAGFYIYDDTTASLKWTGWTTQTASQTLTDIITMGDAILTGLMSSQDFWNISADILNAYGDNILSVAPVPVDYLLLPTFDLEVLSQIQNIYMVGALSVNQNVNDITQDATGSLIYSPRVAYGSANYQNRSTFIPCLTYDKRIINMYKDQVEPGDVFVATRLSPTIVGSGSNTIISSSGTELIGWMNIWSYVVSNGVRTLFCNTTARGLFGGNYDTTVSTATLNHFYDIISELSNVAYHPHIVAYYCVNDGSGYEAINTTEVIGDVANFTVMNNDDLAKLHTSALFSLFQVPTLGGFNG